MGRARKFVLTNRAASLANERPVPLSILPLVSRMIVPPVESYEENEDDIPMYSAFAK